MSDDNYSWVWDEEKPNRAYEGTKPPATVGAIVNRKGQFQKYRVMDVTTGWRSIKLSTLEDKNVTQTVSWDQFENDYEVRWF